MGLFSLTEDAKLQSSTGLQLSEGQLQSYGAKPFSLVQAALIKARAADTAWKGQVNTRKENSLCTVQHWNGFLRVTMKPSSLEALKIRLDQAMLNEPIYSWQLPCFNQSIKILFIQRSTPANLATTLLSLKQYILMLDKLK